MFTGIIEEKGKIDKIIKGSREYKLVIKCGKVLGGAGDDSTERPTMIGDSIAVNGICLTVTELTSDTFTADVMPETISRTSLDGASTGTTVNLERAMPAYGRFGGHIVSGHIDGTGNVTERKDDGNAVWFTIRTEPDIARLIVEKGSVAIDGISLTVASVTGNTFRVSIIPHTMKETTLLDRRPGDTVNLETDVVGKYVAKLFDERGSGTSGSNEEAYNGKKPSLLDLI